MTLLGRLHYSINVFPLSWSLEKFIASIFSSPQTVGYSTYVQIFLAGQWLCHCCQSRHHRTLVQIQQLTFFKNIFSEHFFIFNSIKRQNKYKRERVAHIATFLFLYFYCMVNCTVISCRCQTKRRR